jgi:hypothetical protein
MRRAFVWATHALAATLVVAGAVLCLLGSALASAVRGLDE